MPLGRAVSLIVVGMICGAAASGQSGGEICGLIEDPASAEVSSVSRAAAPTTPPSASAYAADRSSDTALAVDLAKRHKRKIATVLAAVFAVKKFLGAFHRERRNHNAAAALHRLLD